MTTRVAPKKRLLRFSVTGKRRAKRAEVIALSTTEVRGSFADWVNRVHYGGQLIRLERHGKAVAGLVPPDLLELLRRIEDKIDLRAALEALEEGEGKPWSKLKEELGL